MTTGSWEPTSTAPLNQELLRLALPLANADPIPDTAPAELEALKKHMQQTQSHWQAVLAEFSDEELRALCRFFTLAEETWSDWYGGDKNPVIWICKELKKRGSFPDKELTRWIKQNTQNRFLPYGSALG